MSDPGGADGRERSDPDDGPRWLVAIDHDDGWARHVGRTADGRQFFLTTPFTLGEDGGDPGTNYLALYVFDAGGAFLDADIRRLEEEDPGARTIEESLAASLLGALGGHRFRRIEVEPFVLECDGEQFGLVPVQHDGEWFVEAQPGDYMSFFEPWDSGVYDT